VLDENVRIYETALIFIKATSN